jgi:hypothetical protein
MWLLVLSAVSGVGLIAAVHHRAPTPIPVAFVGTVVRQSDGMPLAYGSVYLEGTSSGVAIDSSGRFRLKAKVERGEHTILARSIGFDPARQRVTVRDSGEVVVPALSLKAAAIAFDDGPVPNCTQVRKKPRRIPKGWFTRTVDDSLGQRQILLCCFPER